VHTRGLTALAQAAGLPPEHYSTPAGADAAAVVAGGAHAHEGVYVTLRRALQQIGAELAGGSRALAASGSAASALASGVFSSDGPASARGAPLPEPPPVRLRAGVELEGDAAGFGIAERCVAVESLDFMLDVLAAVRPRVEAHVPASHVTALANFYSRAVLCATQLRGLMYHSLVPRVLPESGAIPNMVATVKWCVPAPTGSRALARRAAPCPGALTPPHPPPPPPPASAGTPCATPWTGPTTRASSRALCRAPRRC